VTIPDREHLATLVAKARAIMERIEALRADDRILRCMECGNRNRRHAQSCSIGAWLAEAGPL
jgi:hypothetical protein